MAVSNLDLTGDGVEEIAIATTRGLQILQHDIDKVQVKTLMTLLIDSVMVHSNNMFVTFWAVF